MAGLYIHIPFCAKKCFYCDFYVTLSVKYKDDYIKALKKEIFLRKDYLKNEELETIYFGGGTPSLFSVSEINIIVNEIIKHHKTSKNTEITLEANPDDLNKSFLTDLKQTEINRLSIGVQSFFDDDLKLMNRRHNSQQSRLSIINAKETGYENITVDLIYGLPGMTIKKWKKNLNTFFNYDIPHLSAYHLTYEAKTVFDKYLKTGKIKQISEEESLEQFELLRNSCKKHGYIHYETSNFAKEGYLSRHNSSYWQQKKYLGIGTAAHSYDGESRQNNIANIKTYISGIDNEKEYFSKELLTEKDKYNDYIITSLRTTWGINIEYIEKEYGLKYKDHFLKESKIYLKAGLLEKKENIIRITKPGKFIEDRITENLFFYE